MKSNYQVLLQTEIYSIEHRPGCDFSHIDLILNFADQLNDIYGGDEDVISAAILLRNLSQLGQSISGEGNIIGINNKDNQILDRIGFPSRKIGVVLQLIKDNDQINGNPRTIEWRILKDAEFLAGLCIGGIHRYAMRYENNGREQAELQNILNPNLPENIKGLEFKESKNYAHKAYIYSKLISTLLDKTPNLIPSLPGKYIILEGNGGTGKSTQANLLYKHYINAGQECLIVNEPSYLYWLIDELWQNKFNTGLIDDGTLFRRFLIIGDREKQLKEVIIPALKKGTCVISVRSFISMLVYQCLDEFDKICTTFIHTFLPTPNLVIIYDADEDLCFERIRGRNRIGLFDTLDGLRKYREKFLDITKFDCLGCPIEIIDASGSMEKVSTLTLNTLRKHKLYDSKP